MAVTVAPIMLHIWTSKRRCMCMHRAALSWRHSKCDISGKRQPCCAHTERLICTCTITTAHPECLSAAHVHNVCTEHALWSPLLQGPDKNTFCGRKLLVLSLPWKPLIDSLILDEDIHRTDLSLLPNPIPVQDYPPHPSKPQCCTAFSVLWTETWQISLHVAKMPVCSCGTPTDGSLHRLCHCRIREA